MGALCLPVDWKTAPQRYRKEGVDLTLVSGAGFKKPQRLSVCSYQVWRRTSALRYSSPLPYRVLRLSAPPPRVATRQLLNLHTQPLLHTSVPLWRATPTDRKSPLPPEPLNCTPPHWEGDGGKGGQRSDSLPNMTLAHTTWLFETPFSCTVFMHC